jgi:hypothetical protein
MKDQEKLQVLNDYENTCNGTNEFHQFKALNAAALLSDGVLLMIDTFESYWLIDLILSYQTKAFKKANPPIENPIQYWVIDVKEDNSCEVYMEYHEGIKVISQKIEYTDFPVINKTIIYNAYDAVICLIAED